MTVNRRVLYACVSFIILLTVIFLLQPHNELPLREGIRADRVVIEKTAHTLTLFSQGQPIKSYQIALGRGGMEPKVQEGDLKTPEGLYRIDGRNLQSAYHLALHISYPEQRDKDRAAALGVKPGFNIMIHGIRNGLGWIGRWHSLIDWTAGCIAVTNAEIEEILSVVPDGTIVEIRH